MSDKETNDVYLIVQTRVFVAKKDVVDEALKEKPLTKYNYESVFSAFSEEDCFVEIISPAKTELRKLKVKVKPEKLTFANTEIIDDFEFPREYFLAEEVYDVLEVHRNVNGSIVEDLVSQTTKKDIIDEPLYYLIKTEEGKTGIFPVNLFDVIEE